MTGKKFANRDAAMGAALEVVNSKKQGFSEDGDIDPAIRVEPFQDSNDESSYQLFIYDKPHGTFPSEEIAMEKGRKWLKMMKWSDGSSVQENKSSGSSIWNKYFNGEDPNEWANENLGAFLMQITDQDDTQSGDKWEDAKEMAMIVSNYVKSRVKKDGSI